MAWYQWLVVGLLCWPLAFAVVAVFICGCGCLRDEVRR